VVLPLKVVDEIGAKFDPIVIAQEAPVLLPIARVVALFPISRAVPFKLAVANPLRPIATLFVIAPPIARVPSIAVSIEFNIILFTEILPADKLVIDTLNIDALLTVILITEMLFVDKFVIDTLLIDALLADKLVMDALNIDTLYVDALFTVILRTEMLFADKLVMDAL
jgi:hypothetical protein